MKLLPPFRRVPCTPHSHAPSVTSLHAKSRAYVGCTRVCLSVNLPPALSGRKTGIFQLRTDAVTREWNAGYRNTSQHRHRVDPGEETSPAYPAAGTRTRVGTSAEVSTGDNCVRTCFLVYIVGRTAEPVPAGFMGSSETHTHTRARARARTHARTHTHTTHTH